MAATLLGNFYGSEGFGFRNYAGALPGPGGIELLALKALGAATGIGGMAAAGAATALGGPLASASTGGGHMMGLESLMPGVEVLGALKGGAKGVTKKLLKGASALLGDDTSSSSSSSGPTTTTIMTGPSSIAGSGPAAKMGALIDSIERKRTKVKGGAVKTIGGVLTKVGQAWQAAGNKMQGGAAIPTTVVYSDMQSGTGTTYSPSSSSMMPSSGGSYIMPGSTSTMGGMANLGSSSSNAFGSSGGFGSSGQGAAFGGGSSGGVTGGGFGSSGGGMAGAGAGSGGLSGGNFGITAVPGGINIKAGVGATGTTGAGAGAGGMPMQGGLAQPQMQAPGFSSQAFDSAGQMSGGQMQGFAPAGVLSSNAPVVNPTNPNVVSGVPGTRLESGSLSAPQQQAAAGQQQQAAALQQQQQWLQQWQLPSGAGQVNAQPQLQQNVQQQALQQQQMDQTQQLQAQQQLQMQQQQYQQLQAQQLQHELQQQQFQQQQLLQQQQQQQLLQQQQQQATLQQQQQSWPLSGLNLESGALQQQQGDVPVSGPYKSTDELVATALQQAAILGAGGSDWNLRKANPKAVKAWKRISQQE
jgi:hypothetical protein